MPKRAGRRASDKVIKPKGAIQTHGDKKLDTAVRLSAATTHADAYPVKHTRARGHWTPVEDATLNSEVSSARKKKYSKDYKTDCTAVKDAVQTQDSMHWGAIAEMVPDPRQI
jgi:hypothetical protein